MHGGAICQYFFPQIILFCSVFFRSYIKNEYELEMILFTRPHFTATEGGCPLKKRLVDAVNVE